jgi:hypothetical protein
MDASQRPVRTGLALAIIVGLAYATCALFFWLLPDAAVNIANAIFHGVDFRKIQTAGGAFDLSGFFTALVVLAACSSFSEWFLIGCGMRSAGALEALSLP